MKFLTKALIISWIMLAGCDAANAPSKESQMFGKPSAKHYVIASPMEGVLMKDGEPLANVKILRRLRWNGNEGGQTSEFYSDKNGRFVLPAHEEALSLGMMDQFVAKTEIRVEHEGGNQLLWYNSKLFPEMHAETGGAVEDLVCDLAYEELSVPMGPTAIITRCRWSGMPE